MTDRATVAERAARDGADVAQAGFRRGLAVERKDGKTDVVTQADRDAQDVVLDAIRAHYPSDPVVGEEADELKAIPEFGPAWVVDPIDGTNNFVRDIPLWATAVAAVEDMEALAAAVVLPALGDVYLADDESVTLNGRPASVSDRTDPETFAVCPTIWWDFDRRDEYARACESVVERFGDLRRFGSAQAVLAMVAAGQLDAAITNVRANPWDSVAGAHMVDVAGGTVTDLTGEPWRPDSRGIVASNGEAHDVVLDAARDIDG
ncbi:inositol monophosphatase family protein [Halocalculus aciditolerans]|uniref:fructose-bisphosphatase n=1 Tax=Halocalculus aciditolerans TaxID=1383812 RepID=A0A830F7X0_9EURY|nr:inositol monophosphatase [Halocalculus aciditolerans]GGL63470.1 inositol monophosphatase [Halocalculus aciditolerans]